MTAATPFHASSTLAAAAAWLLGSGVAVAAFARGAPIEGLGALALGGLAALQSRRLARARRALAEEAARRRAVEERVPAILDHLPARISQFDREQRVVYANRFCGEVHGLAPEALVGRSLREVRGEREYAALEPLIARALAGEHVRHEHALQVGDETRHFRQDYVPDPAADGTPRGFFAISFEITDFRRAEEAARASERRLRDIADNLPALIAYIDPALHLQFANRTMGEWMGVPVATLLGRHVRELWPPEVAAARMPQLQRALAGETASFEAPLGPDRHTHVTYLPDRRADGRVAGVYALVNDVTDMKRVERELERLSRSDPLTGLPNRREFEERLADALARRAAAPEPMALLFVDIDRFKSVNDGHGHAAGDEVLRHVARALRQAAGAGDVVARLAGDEFVALLVAPLDAARAAEVAEGALARVRQAVSFDGTVIRVSTSIGIALLEAADGPAPAAGTLLARADAALYAAKAAGRDTWRMERVTG